MREDVSKPIHLDAKSSRELGLVEPAGGFVRCAVFGRLGSESTGASVLSPPRSRLWITPLDALAFGLW